MPDARRDAGGRVMDVVKGLAALAAGLLLWLGTVAVGVYFGIIGAIVLGVI